ncbi:hypothetical protein FKM82_017133, partial [Ascaphus truei]
MLLFLGEHPEDTLYQRKLKDLHQRYSSVRKTRADGSCFYRALGFAYLESLLGKHQEILRFKDIVIQSKNELLTAGFEEPSFRKYFDAEGSMYRRRGARIGGGERVSEEGSAYRRRGARIGGGERVSEEGSA